MLNTSVTHTQVLQALFDPRNGPAWSEFVRRSAPMLVGFGRRTGLGEADAEELAQSVLAAFAERYLAGGYERERGRLRDFLWGIAWNKRQSLRRRRGVEARGRAVIEESASAPSTDADAFEIEWRRTVLGQALDSVARTSDHATIEAFTLFSLRSLPASAVSQRLGISENAVYLAKRRVLSQLREAIREVEKL